MLILTPPHIILFVSLMLTIYPDSYFCCDSQQLGKGIHRFFAQVFRPVGYVYIYQDVKLLLLY
jgi:hypothetical protein